MKLIKLAILSILLLFFAVTAVSLLIPSQIRISKAINLHASQPALEWIRDTGKWDQWHPFFMNDSLRNKFPTKIQMESTNDSSVIASLRQGNKVPVHNGWIIHRYPSSDSITLQWYMDFQLKWYPWQKFSSLFYESTYGNMMQEGLTNLKAAASDHP